MLTDTERVEAEVPETVMCLANDASTVFHLTGSRYMGGERPDSDWDFITEHSAEAVDALIELGFKPMGHQGSLSQKDINREVYLLDATESILQKIEDDGTVIQVQLVNDLKALLATRDVIKAHLFEEHLKADRDERRYLWKGLRKLLAFQHTDEIF